MRQGPRWSQNGGGPLPHVVGAEVVSNFTGPRRPCGGGLGGPKTEEAPRPCSGGLGGPKTEEAPTPML